MLVFPTRKDWMIAPRGRNWKGAGWEAMFSSRWLRGGRSGVGIGIRIVELESDALDGALEGIDGEERERWNEESLGSEDSA